MTLEVREWLFKTQINIFIFLNAYLPIILNIKYIKKWIMYKPSILLYISEKVLGNLMFLTILLLKENCIFHIYI